ncbi:zona pellucida sperm-binding protein 3-like [Mustelus asterias]
MLREFSITIRVLFTVWEVQKIYYPIIAALGVPFMCALPDNQQLWIWGAVETVHYILTPFVPFLLILLLNALTVRHILVSSGARRRLRLHSSGKNPSDPEIEKRRKSIILLFVISGNFILLWVMFLSVRVQCGEDKLLLRVQLDLFGTRHLVKAADLTLGTAGCRPTRIYSQNHTVLFDYGLHECGSRLQMTGDFLIYSTHLSHSPEYHGTVIVRTNGAIVPIECHYFRKGNVSSNPIKPTWIPFSSTRSGEGHLSFSLRLMNGDWLTERTSTVYYLGELIHIEASVSMSNHMALKLYIDRCVATLRPDKDSSPRYSIIDYNGCLLDSKAEDSFSTFVLPGDEQEPDKLRFDLDAFRFFGDERSLIFITCHLKVVPVDQIFQEQSLYFAEDAECLDPIGGIEL